MCPASRFTCGGIFHVQNWVKHGLKKATKNAHYSPIIGELLLFDSIECHGNLFHRKSHLMLLFIARWTAENPSPGNALIRPIILRMAKVQDLTERDRTEFLKEGFKRLAAGD